MKVCESCSAEIFTTDGNNRCSQCENKPASKKRARTTRREMDAIMRSCGLTRVRGALGGVYYE
jgi:hypothetical protein